MAHYDRLPTEVRLWLSQAALPWSARSVYRLWRKLQDQTKGDVAEMLVRLDRIEGRMLDRDCAAIWGRDYPRPGSAHDMTGHQRPLGTRR